MWFKSSPLRLGSCRVRLSIKKVLRRISYGAGRRTSRDFVARSRPLAAKKGSLRSPRGRLVANLLPGIPMKNSNNRKIVSARGTIGRGKERELPLFLPPILPRALTFFLLPSLPTTQRDLYGGERVWEPGGRNSTLNTQKYKNLFTQAKSSRFLCVGYSKIKINVLRLRSWNSRLPVDITRRYSTKLQLQISV